MAWPENVPRAQDRRSNPARPHQRFALFTYSDVRVHHWSRVRNADVNEMVDAALDRRGDGSFDGNEISGLPR
jgi:hypothetical protein